MSNIDIEQLLDLDNTKKLRKIFQELNYEPEFIPVSTRNWKEDIVNTIADENISLLASHKDFHVIYCKLDKLLLGYQRPIINQLLKDHPYLIVIFSDKEEKNWHFVNVKHVPEFDKREKVKADGYSDELLFHKWKDFIPQLKE